MILRLRYAIPLMALVFVSIPAAAANVAGNAQQGAGKAAACGACHGPQGISVVPTFPSLAGLPASYTVTQLERYQSGARKDPMMSAQVAGLSPQDLDNIATYFASLPAKPAGRPDTASRGGVLYVNGDPAHGIPACQGCHGAAGEGAGAAMARYPRLAGQPASYVAKVLTDYKSGSNGNDASAKIMGGVVQNIGSADIQALATYIAGQ
jgi:cytochrome c553